AGAVLPKNQRARRLMREIMARKGPEGGLTGSSRRGKSLPRETTHRGEEITPLFHSWILPRRGPGMRERLRKIFRVFCLCPIGAPSQDPLCERDFNQVGVRQPLVARLFARWRNRVRWITIASPVRGLLPTLYPEGSRSNI